jgi:hypothetical protein
MDKPDDNESYVVLSDVARVLSINHSSIYTYRQKGIIQLTKIEGRTHLSPDEIWKLIMAMSKNGEFKYRSQRSKKIVTELHGAPTLKTTWPRRPRPLS